MEDSNKYSMWMVTIQEGETEFDSHHLPTSEEVGNSFETISDNFVFQKERCPSSGRDHWQCCLKTKIRKRQQTLLNDLVTLLDIKPTCVQIDRVQGTWEQAKEYCSKKDTRVSKDTYKRENGAKVYEGSDIKFLSERENRYPWQNYVYDKIFEDNSSNIKDPDDRTIIWIQDSQGNTGKSKFVKYCCFSNNTCTKISFGSASQLRSGLISTGVKKVYFIDIPRTLGVDDSMNNILSAIEDLKNGFLTSNFYGNSSQLMMEPPHIIIFTNMECPQEKLSSDRWHIYNILQKDIYTLQNSQLVRVS